MKNLIFDFANVIASFDQDEVFYNYTDSTEDADYIKDLFDSKKIWDELYKGKTIERVYNKAIKRVNPKYHKPIKEILTNWYKFFDINGKMERYLEKLKEESVNLYLFANFSDQFVNIERSNQDLINLFDGVYISYVRGFIKPTYISYLDFLKQNKLKAEDCLLIDTCQESLTIAKELDFETYPYDGDLEKLKRFINKWLYNNFNWHIL